MRQRVAIARTLILSPRIILMDEPFGALDPTTRLHMQALLVDLWKEAQATVFFVTHSIEEAVYLGDRVYVFSAAPGTILRQMDVNSLEDLFQKIVASAALDAGAQAQIIKFLHQAPDHPIALHFPESAYLKGLICRKVA